jgi:hypothetical protein
MPCILPKSPALYISQNPHPTKFSPYTRHTIPISRSWSKHITSTVTRFSQAVHMWVSVSPCKHWITPQTSWTPQDVTIGRRKESYHTLVTATSRSNEDRRHGIFAVNCLASVTLTPRGRLGFRRLTLMSVLCLSRAVSVLQLHTYNMTM